MDKLKSEATPSVHSVVIVDTFKPASPEQERSPFSYVIGVRPTISLKNYRLCEQEIRPRLANVPGEGAYDWAHRVCEGFTAFMSGGPEEYLRQRADTIATVLSAAGLEVKVEPEIVSDCPQPNQ